MGLRINLQHASWFAHILKPFGAVPSLQGEQDWAKSEINYQFLRQLEDGFFSEVGHERMLREEIRALGEAVQRSPSEFSARLTRVRHFLGDRPWTALLLPSGRGGRMDTELCDQRVLQEIIHIHPEDLGLVLQLQEPPRDTFALNDLFPAFRTALASVNRWPGILIWLNSGDSNFFPLDESHRFHDQLHWIFSHLAASRLIDFEELAALYEEEFLKKKPIS